MGNTIKSQLTAGCIALILTLIPSISHAALYALGQMVKNGSTPQSLYSIDPATGASTLIGSTGFALRGLAINPLTERLYSVGNASGTPYGLYEIDRSTGAATHIGGDFVGASMSFGLDGTLYAITPHNGGNAENHQIFTLDLTTGAETFFVEISHNDYGGLAVTADGSSITYIGDNGVESVDIVSKVVTPITDWYDDLDGYPGRIAYNADGTLYGVSIPDYATSLYTIDIGAETASSIGDTGVHLYGLAFVSGPGGIDSVPGGPTTVPIPTTSAYGLVLIVLGLLLVASRKLRKSASLK